MNKKSICFLSCTHASIQQCIANNEINQPIQRNIKHIINLEI